MTGRRWVLTVGGSGGVLSVMIGKHPGRFQDARTARVGRTHQLWVQALGGQ